MNKEELTKALAEANEKIEELEVVIGEYEKELAYSTQNIDNGNGEGNPAETKIQRRERLRLRHANA